MAKINHLDMSEKLMSLQNIEIKKSCFGLKTTVYYVPTHSRIKVMQNEYNTENGERVEIILRADDNAVENLIKSNNIEATSMGNMRLDACISEDHAFAAVQLLRFTDFDYTPITDMRTYQGDAAKAIASLF